MTESEWEIIQNTIRTSNLSFDEVMKRLTRDVMVPNERVEFRMHWAWGKDEPIDRGDVNDALRYIAGPQTIGRRPALTHLQKLCFFRFKQPK